METNDIQDIKECDAYYELLDKHADLVVKYDTIVKICKIVMHDIRSPLRFLSDVAESLTLEGVKQPEHVQRKHLKMLVETCQNLSHFGNNVLDWFISNKFEISLQQEKVNISETLRENIRIYENVIESNNNVLDLDFEDDIFVSTNKEISSIIIRNAIDNANKYTRDGVIKISVARWRQTVSVSIIDNGKGFDAEKLLEQIHDNVTVSHNLGFRIIHDMAKQVGLEYTISSKKGVGTNFALIYTQV
ncbi:MAG: HAMP domain-containing histidine kinase [Bacteroidetes bacterium]|nr:HAMP domain-containing histidine kinase [Bacteroidota bacterium]